MTRETRIGFVVALALIVMFALVLSELAGPSRRAESLRTTAVSRAGRTGWSPVIQPETVVRIDSVAVEASVASPVGGEQERVIRLAAELPVVQPQSAGPAPTLQARRTRRRTYTVRPNDSLRKIARTVYGHDHEESYQLIFEANRNVLDDESLVTAGQVLVIPPLAGIADDGRLPVPTATAAVQVGRGYREMDLSQLQEHFSVQAPPGALVERKPSGRIYVVRQGDSLSRIARRTLNDDSHAAVMKIYKANRDKLSDPDVLPVGARLRIPS